ncbi:polysaccharide deacetylase family protein [Brevibacillus sp. SYP-B805]|uniref:polysaccharide deacetylase family protein n=1 Tax=Brevibacillus sp. SYP-B805 TaxID=1578199 RepID=UPI0013EC0156|nr:polysaccharide deacetylase family protein [Brevibacillus sp. SYP-B805]NGQ93981.1 polysaccharide deacetylase family protein [Brevibacillus sp. SYP-B805]
MIKHLGTYVCSLLAGVWLIFPIAHLSQKTLETRFSYANHDLMQTAIQLNRSEPVPVLMYHSISFEKSPLCVSPKQFEIQLRNLLKHGFTPITARDLFRAWDTGMKLPSRPVVLTFDDGYQDNYTHAFPILKKYKAKATLFVITGSIGKPRYLNWGQLEIMERSGLVDVESHTVTHPDVRHLTRKQFYYELAESKRVLETRLHKKVCMFAYPYGKYTKKWFPVLSAMGYQAAFTTKNRLTEYAQGRYSLKRLRVFPHDTFSHFPFEDRVDF